MNNNEKIAILLCTYNGERYIREQLDSIIVQRYENWIIYVADDGSTDNTLSILKEYELKIDSSKLVITQGPRKGFAWNFISSLQKNGEDCDFFCFCDQDDIWLETKLENAIIAMKNLNINPKRDNILYGARTFLTDEYGKNIGMSSLFSRPLCLKNALLQTFAGGNTMLLSKSLRDEVSKIPEKESIVSHDWLLYIICTALNGIIIYDETPCLLYRQHSENIVGSNLGISSKICRVKKIFQGKFKAWNLINKNNLSYFLDKISNENLKIIHLYYNDEKKSRIRRVKSFIKSGVYRQSKIESYFLLIMSYFGKL